MVPTMSRPSSPIRIALVDDYDVVVIGLAHMLAPFGDRITVVELDVQQPVSVDVDIALYDTFAQPESDRHDIHALLDNAHAAKVVIYTWSFDPALIAAARRRGIHGYLAKSLPARQLVEALEAVHGGEVVVSVPPRRVHSAPGLDWPGRAEGLTDREAEILALITQGRGNAEIAAMTYLSPNTIKSYIRSVYRKIGVSSRTQAVLWGVHHGFAPTSHRLDDWRTP
jgi:DNA-binding NarL/FixJ family response regulator